MKSVIRVVAITVSWLPLSTIALLKGWVPAGSRAMLAFIVATTLAVEVYATLVMIYCCVGVAMTWSAIATYLYMGIMIQIPNIYSGPMLVWNRPARGSRAGFYMLAYLR